MPESKLKWIGYLNVDSFSPDNPDAQAAWQNAVLDAESDKSVLVVFRLNETQIPLSFDHVECILKTQL